MALARPCSVNPGAARLARFEGLKSRSHASKPLNIDLCRLQPVFPERRLIGSQDLLRPCPDGIVLVPAGELFIETAHRTVDIDLVAWVGCPEVFVDGCYLGQQCLMLGRPLERLDLLLGPTPAIGNLRAITNVAPQRQKLAAGVRDL